MSPIFDNKLENFGVDTVQLKKSATHRFFRAWVEESEEEAIYKAWCVVEAHMMEKYRYLDFYYMDDEVTCAMYYKKLEWLKKNRGMKGSRNRWALLGTHPDMDDDDKIEPFDISDLVIGLIVSIPHATGVQILRQDVGYVEEDK